MKYLWPVQATKKRITSPYGWRLSPTSGAKQLHAAIDIGADKGTVIFATLDGVVKFAGYDKSGGNHLCIYHATQKQYSGYLHCNELLARPGQVVKQGDIIGKVGSTGDSTGPHLHFAVGVEMTSGGYVKKDTAFDPAKLAYVFIADLVKPEPPKPEIIEGKFKVKVISETLAIRPTASTIKAKIGLINRGATLTVLRTFGSWGQLGTGLWISIKPAYVTKI